MTHTLPVMNFVQNNHYNNQNTCCTQDYSDLMEDLYTQHKRVQSYLKKAQKKHCGTHTSASPDLNGDGCITPFEAFQWLTSQTQPPHHSQHGCGHTQNNHGHGHHHNPFDDMMPSNWGNDWHPASGHTGMMKHMLYKLKMLCHFMNWFKKHHKCEHVCPEQVHEPHQPRNILSQASRIASRKPGFIENFQPMSIFAKTFEMGWMWKRDQH